MGFKVSINCNPYASGGGSATMTVQPLNARIENIPTSFLDFAKMAILSPLRALESLFKPSYSSFSQPSLTEKEIVVISVKQFSLGSIFENCVKDHIKDFFSFYQIPAIKLEKEHNEIPKAQSMPHRYEPEAKTESGPQSRAQSAPRSEPKAETAPPPQSKAETASGSRPRAQSESGHRPKAEPSPSSRPRAQSAPRREHNAQSTQRASKPAQQESNPAVELRNRALGLLGVKKSNPSNYSLLGLPEGADKAAIKKAYVKLSLQFHPDKYKGDDKPAAEEAFKIFSAAYHTLYDN
ncbi:MAG: DnaJ domain-containing protein [Verrucomicrobia bacterium]|nr:DnaJ domain-containing protein [Verrucomicrobiota bacterium]